MTQGNSTNSNTSNKSINTLFLKKKKIGVVDMKAKLTKKLFHMKGI